MAERPHLKTNNDSERRAGVGGIELCVFKALYLTPAMGCGEGTGEGLEESKEEGWGGKSRLRYPVSFFSKTRIRAAQPGSVYHSP